MTGVHNALVPPPVVGKPVGILFRVFALVGAFVSLLGFAGAWAWQLDLLAHFRVQYSLVLALLTGLLLLARSRRVALVVGVVAVLNVAQVVPVYVPATRASPTRPRVRVMMANVYTDNQQHERLLEYIHREDPDIILLTEVDQRWTDALRVIEEEYPHSVAETDLGNFGIALYSRFQPRVIEVRSIGDVQAPPSVFAELEAHGSVLTILGTHPVPPVNAAQALSRDRQLAALAQLAAAVRGPVILLGDLNLTPWSPHFSELLERSGLRDTRNGFGVHATWPAGDPTFLKIPIDHCLVSDDVTVVDRSVGPELGSDHNPVVVDLAPR